MTKKRFLLFAHDDYYPCGGLDDWVESFDNVQDAIDYFYKLGVNDCYEDGGILDIETLNTYRYNRTTKKWSINEQEQV